ncbi:tetratricopeptide repeat protein [Pleionea mediterranea]|uniref:Tetratricopeptide repeat protein n=1 Tax=Pleionea mediterranea TaxID=523701 RepID=A0A316FM30_9GAMM|nr:tetratricopeptide repeat protein [Pleionea mediterranea]PWK49172.1 tetratricopeptide repeat protein [Pleionea mediterranea]
MTEIINTKNIEKGIKQIIATGQGYGPEFKTALKTTQAILKKINKGRQHTAHNYFELAQCFIQLEDTELAMNALKKALSIKPDHVDSLCLLIALLDNLGMFAQASMVTDDLLQLNPDNIEANFQKALLLYKLKDYVLAIQYAIKASTGDDIHQEALILLGSCFNELAEYQHALKFLQVAYYANSNHTELYYQLGKAYYYTFNFIKAEKLYRRGLEIDDTHYELNVALFKTYLELGDQKKLRHYLAKAVWLQRKAPQSLFYLGFYYGAVSEFDKATGYYKKALVKNPGDDTAKMNIAHIYQVRGEYDKAIPIYEDIIARKSDAAQSSINLGLIYIAKGELEKGFKVSNNRFSNMAYKYSQLNWSGESLSGKKILLRKEQGIGDQIETAWYFNLLQNENVDATVQVDERLIPLLKRSFPKFNYVTFSDDYINSEHFERFDYQILQKSLGIIYHTKITEAYKNKKYTEKGFLTVDTDLFNQWSERLKPYRGKSVVGIAWRSGLMNRSRKGYYLDVSDIISLFKDKDVTLVNLQYSFTKQELDLLTQTLGDKFVHFEDIDLKDDQDNLAALIKNLDLVFTAPTAVYDLCGAIGKRTLCYSYAHTELAAKMYGCDSNPMFPDVDMIWSVGKSVAESMDLISNRLNEHLKEHKNV